MFRYKNDDYLIESGKPCDTFYVIREGAVLMTTSAKAYRLGVGDVVGIADITSENHSFSYTAKGNVAADAFSYGSPEEFLELLSRDPALKTGVLSSLASLMRQLIDVYYNDYEACKELCGYVHSVADFYVGACKELGCVPKVPPFADELMSTKVRNELAFWMEEYYEEISRLAANATDYSDGYVYGFIIKCCQDLAGINDLILKLKIKGEALCAYLISDDFLDYYELYADLYFKSVQKDYKADFVTDIMNKIIDSLKKSPFSDKALVVKRVVSTKARLLKATQNDDPHADDATASSELMNSINIILDYADTLDITANEFRKAIESYKNQIDKITSDKMMDDTRKSLIKIYNVIYTEVMLKAICDDNIPNIVKMFINFGYVDSSLCGYDNALELYHISERFHGNLDRGIFTILEWMKAIYTGLRQPSRNEFEQDYQGYIRSLIRENRIDAQEEKAMLEDSKGKVVYELENMLPTVNKITFGRILSYCPILLEENLYKSIDSMLMSIQVVESAFDKISAVDYSAFYHESVFEDYKLNVKEQVYSDIRPDIILMPNVGSRGILWQEIEGLRRDTPGRMMISILHQESLDKTFLRMVGEFRWEMCKREQGMRWNDVSSHSLTADYCDYIQFYAKNRDLSLEAKDKIKENLKRNKNNYREMFIYDYIQYMVYETNGSSRLNKVARSILFKYCPPGEVSRNLLRGNAIFEESLSKLHVTTAARLHRLEQVENKYKSAGKPFPEELAMQYSLIKR